MKIFRMMKSGFYTTLLLFLFLNDAIAAGNDPSNNQPEAVVETLPLKMKSYNDILKNYASYNRWANEQFFGWFKGVPEEIMKQEVESSFPSLYLTLLHLWDAEYGWLNTVLGEPWGTPPGRSFDGSMKELFEGFLATSSAFETAVHQLKDDDFLQTRPPGDNGTALEDIILHVFNHATFHRGQLITIGRQVGLSSPPRSDYIYYVRQLNQ